MIHQLIFASPTPGMSEEEFQRYWLEVHAVKYASKIPQIKRYMIDTRVPSANEFKDPLFSGVAEIWLENEEEQLKSLQSKEFLQGARLDEPNWAAFWRTIGLDTDTHVLMEGPPLTKNPTWVKMMILNRRKEGVPLETYRNYSLEVHAPLVLLLPGLRRYIQCHSKDGLYAMGESRFDGVWQLWFDDISDLKCALASKQYQEKVKPDLNNFVETRYLFDIIVAEHWIIGPEAR
jgi:uncharacterized protein (TIGR02118 family)